jgi:hypothetical protein
MPESWVMFEEKVSLTRGFTFTDLISNCGENRDFSRFLAISRDLLPRLEERQSDSFTDSLTGTGHDSFSNVHAMRYGGHLHMQSQRGLDKR